jgi:hypothetical protein
MAYALLAFARGDDAPPDGGHVPADRQVHALNECGVDLLTQSGQHVLNASPSAAHHVLAHRNQPSASGFLDDLRTESPGQGHPVGLRGRACGPLARWLDPRHKVGPHCHSLLIDGFSQLSYH